VRRRGKGTRKGGGGGSEVTSASWRWTWSGTAPSQTLRAASSDHGGSSYGATIAAAGCRSPCVYWLSETREPKEGEETHQGGGVQGPPDQSFFPPEGSLLLGGIFLFTAVKEASSLWNHFYLLCSIDCFNQHQPPFQRKRDHACEHV
jgi:hypothetical protein